MSRVAYPNSIPMESVSNLIRIVRNGAIQTEIKEFAADVWNVQGYLQTIVPGKTDAIVNGLPPSEEFKAKCLELAKLLKDAKLPAMPTAKKGKAVAAAGPVGSDFSVFLHELSSLGFVKAFANFILRIFNQPVS